MLDRRHLLRALAVGGAAAATPALGRGLALAGEPRGTYTGEGVVRSAYGDAAVSTDRVVVPMVFPVVGRVSYTDTFLACRSGCTRRHFGQDLMGAKMLPLVATFHGTVASLKRESTPGEGSYVCIRGDNGWSANYLHVNNDTPGTDDGRGTARYAFAPGLALGMRVVPGQLLGWLGDSGNAEGTAPHLHFELRRGGPWDGVVYNAKASLDAAQRIAAPRVAGPHPDGALLRADVGGPTWLLENGRKRLVSPTVLAINGWSTAQVLVVSKVECDWYPRHWDLGPRDGLVLRAPDGGHWVVADGRRVALPDAAALALTGVRQTRVRPVDAATLAMVPVAPAGTPVPGPLRTGALVRRQWDSRVWLLGAGVRRLVPDVATMTSWGWTFDDVLPVPATAFDDVDDKEPYAEVEPVLVRDGTVLRHAVGGWLWVVSGGRKRFVSNLAAFRERGYGRIAPLSVASATLDRLPDGPTYP